MATTEPTTDAVLTSDRAVAPPVAPTRATRSAASERGSVTLLVNPERTDLSDDIERHLDDRGIAVERVGPDDPARLGAEARRAVDRGADLVAAVGGDGTQRTVAAALAGTGAALAVVPGGTVNLLGRVLGIDDVEAAAGAIAGGRTRSIDLARCNGDPFVLNASSGYDAQVIDAVDDGAKRFGRLGYTLVGVREFVRRRARGVTVDLDGDRWFDGRAFTVLVLNVGERGSASLRLAPDAEPDDGRLDVVVVRDRPARQVLAAIWAIVRGREPDPDAVVIGQAAAIDVVWDTPVPVQRDGDADGRSRTLHYDVAPDPVRVATP